MNSCTLSIGGLIIGAGVAPLRVVHAIDQEAEVIGARAVDRVCAVAAVAFGDHAAGEVGQVGEIAAIERHLGDLLRGGDFAAGAALRVEPGGASVTVTVSATDAHRHLDVDALGSIDLQRDWIRHLVGSEPGQEASSR